MKIILLISFFNVFLFSDENIRKEFLTQYEYGKALYKKPRGIGCIECHGRNGEGSVISYIKQKNKNKPIIAPNIRGVGFIKFESALKNGKGVMPRYNLTASEMLALYIYLNPNFKQP
ncbi:cytochrome c [Helicobacter sp. MIT 14-3879]|uniref:c-type cytochrome n=1 Tax=Helicobacter sp. MIT 14-3879 TaxID=2040649 RepID=UPI000E1F22DA|nr:cytochrome c [Helicobacter sp. MIT 14-3879]RDU60836.1 cytochrome C oxidase subunit III [Helicobacter sp. MIT 14-3879]